MRELVERAYFGLCLVLGRLLKSAKYSKARIVTGEGGPSTGSGSSRAWSRDAIRVRKHRLFYAPLLVWIGGSLLKILDTGVQVLPQHEWHERERQIYWTLRGTSIRIEADGTLILPRIAGETLASVLENPQTEETLRKKAIESAVVALAALHQLGFTHADAMAENVLIDVAAGAHWFDFETVHDPNRTIAWCRADDVRALLATCLVRTVPEKHAETLRLILNVYPDKEVARLLPASFTSVLRRPLTFHLAQAGMSLESFRQIGRLLNVASERSEKK